MYMLIFDASADPSQVTATCCYLFNTMELAAELRMAGVLNWSAVNCTEVVALLIFRNQPAALLSLSIIRPPPPPPADAAGCIRSRGAGALVESPVGGGTGGAFATIHSGSRANPSRADAGSEEIACDIVAGVPGKQRVPASRWRHRSSRRTG